MMKSVMMIFLLLLSVGFVYAEGLQFVAQPNEEINIFFSCITNNGDLQNANLTYSIFYPNSTIFINQQNLIQFDTGLFSTNITTPNQTGTYLVSVLCDFQGAEPDKEYTQVFQVEDKEKYVESALDMIFGSFLIFLLGILLFWLGAYSKNVFFFFASGLWFIGSAVAISFDEVNLPMTGFFLLISMVAIYHGIGQVYRNKKEITNDKMRRMRDD